MAKLTVDIDDKHLPRLKAMVANMGPRVLPGAVYATASGGKIATEANPVPPPLSSLEAQKVAEAMVRKFLRDLLKQHEADAAVEAARLAAVSKVDADGVIPE